VSLLRSGGAPLAALLLAAAAQSAPAPHPAQGSDRRPGAARPAPAAVASVVCRPPAGDPIPAENILRDLSEGRDVALTGRIIEGNIEADRVWPAPDDRVSTQRVVRGQLSLTSCRLVGRLAFPHCAFAKGLDLPCTEVKGDIDLSDAMVPRRLDMSSLRALGDVRLTNLIAGGDVDLEKARLDGLLDMTGVRVLGTLSLADGVFRGRVDLASAVAGAAQIDSSHFFRPVALRDLLVLTDLGMDESIFEGGIQMESVNVTGVADLTNAQVSEGLQIANLSVGQDLLFALHATSPAEFVDLRVAGDLSLVGARFAGISIDRATILGTSELDDTTFDGKVTIRNADFGKSFSADGGRFNGECVFEKVRFPGDDPMSGAVFAKRPSLQDTVLRLTPKELSPSAPDASGEDDSGDDDDDDDSDPNGGL
jgi:hypothetical protein